MIVVLKNSVSKQQVETLITWFKGKGLDVHISEGRFQTILGLIGDTSKVDIDLLNGLEIIEKR